MKTGSYIFLVKTGATEILRTLSLSEAKKTANDFNFEIIKGIDKAKVFKATIIQKA